MARRSDLYGDAWRKRKAIGLRNSGGVCCLCGQPLNLTVNGNHPDGPTLEHVIPVSRGGSPDDPRNLSSSHRRCNVSRGNRLVSEMRRPETPSRQW